MMIGRFLRDAGFGLSCLLFLSAFASPALAQSSYPVRPIRMVVPFTPGGSNDIVERLIGEGLADD